MDRMRNVCILLCLCLGLSACSALSDLLAKKETPAPEIEVPKAHPVGVSYEVMTGNGERKTMSIFYSGDGLARILYRNSGNTKLILDYGKKEITSKDFNSDWVETKLIDEYTYPCVLNARDAAKVKASCLGTGRTRGYPYHRWGLRTKNDEWEVWTDDNDSFPVYFRSIKNGDVTTWTMVNAWIDGSTYDKPTFFTLDPDPTPPAPEAKEEPVELEPEKRHHHKHSQRHRAQKKLTKISG